MADTIGHPLTHHVTINFGLTGISAEDAVAAFRNVRNRYIKWARRPRRGSHAFEPTFAYVFENVRDQSPIEAQDSAHNVHAHWALHVPAARAHEFVQSCRVARPAVRIAQRRWRDTVQSRLVSPRSEAVHAQGCRASMGSTLWRGTRRSRGYCRTPFGRQPKRRSVSAKGLRQIAWYPPQGRLSARLSRAASDRGSAPPRPRRPCPDCHRRRSARPVPYRHWQRRAAACGWCC